VPNRREALVRMGLAVAGIAAPLRGAAPPEDDLIALAASLRDATRERAFDVAADAIRAGASPQALLGAVFLAGVAEIRPRPHGILHTVMMVESACQLSGAAASRREAWHAALFNLDEFKTSQDEDRRDWSDYRMKPLTAPSAGAEPARREFVAAMDAFDAERAERALLALVPHVDSDTFFELLRPIAARCYAFIGHKAIYAVQVERVLRRIGWRHAEPALRSLVLSLLVGRQTESFGRARELARRVPAGWLGVPADPARSESLWAALRTATPVDAPASLVGALQSGAGAASAWDAVILLGSEIFSRRPGRRSADGGRSLLPVHAFTVPSALRHAFLAARADETRRILLLQAAAWVTSLRDDLGSLVGLSMEGPGLSASAEAAPNPEAVLALGSPASALRLMNDDPASAGAVLSQLRRSLARLGREPHQHKYAAAMQEEAARVHPRLRPRLIAPALDYLAHPSDTQTEVFERAESALERAGLA
jgi:hypothetical protein